MRNVVIFCFLIFIAIGCDKENKYPKAEVSSTVNDEVWNSNVPFAFKSDIGVNTLDFQFGFEQWGYQSALLLYNVDKTIGVQQLRKTNYDSLYLINCVFHNSQEEDVTGDEYDILEADSANNWVNITSAKDDFTKDIRGTFSATFVRTKKFMNSPYPDTLRFRNGTFYISKLWD